MNSGQMAVAPFKFGPNGTFSSILGNFKQLHSLFGNFKQLYSILRNFKQLQSNLGNIQILH